MRTMLLVAFTSLSLFADCPDGERNATPAEIAFAQKVLTAMVETFPAAPEGFKQPTLPKPDARLSFCRGTALGDFKMELQLVYERSTSVRERDTPEYAAKQAFEEKIQALKKLSPEAQAKYDAAKKVYDEAYAPYRAAAKANQKEEAARLRKDVDATFAKMTAVEEEHRRAMLPEANRLSEERRKIDDAMRAKYYDPVRVVISVNDAYAKREGKGWTLGAITKPAIKVRKIVYQFRGPEPQVDKFMAAVDQAKLKALQAM